MFRVVGVGFRLLTRRVFGDQGGDESVLPTVKKM